MRNEEISFSEMRKLESIKFREACSLSKKEKGRIGNSLKSYGK